MTDRITAENTAKSPKLIAHRGFAAGAPQNSLPAFIKAGEAGFWAIETDVHKTRDGVLVCNHCTNIDEMYDGSGYIADLSCDELYKYRLKWNGFEKYSDQELKIPLFSEYLSICKQYGALPFIETKTDDIEDVLNSASEFFSEDDIIISSIELRHLIKVRMLSERVFVHHIFSTPETMRELSAAGRCGVSYNYAQLDRFPVELLHEAHGRGALLCLRAGDSPEAVRRMIALGLDYIPTNCVGPKDI